MSHVMNGCELGGNLTWLLFYWPVITLLRGFYFQTESEFVYLPVHVVIPLSTRSKSPVLCKYNLHTEKMTQSLFNFLLTFSNKFSFQ